MKIKYLFFFTIFTLFCNAQVVTISNVNFKNALINSLCVDADLNGTYESDADLNNDGQIQLSEAQAVQRLKVSNKSISLLTGISSFTNLKVLLCDNNLLSTNTLSLSSLSNLTTLDCSHNALTALNLAPTFSTLTNLVSLNCSYNQLTSLNLADTNLLNLNASNNNLNSLTDSNGNLALMTDLNISNNQFTTFTVNGQNLVSFIYANNPLTQLNFNSYGNSPINVTNLPTLQSLTFNYLISIPSLTLSLLPNLNYFKVYYSTIVSDVLLTNLPSLNSVDFQSDTSSLTLGANLGFTSMVNGYQTPNTVNIRAINFHITNSATITDINLFSFNVVNFSIDNMANLTSLKIPDGEILQTMSFNSMPQLQTLEIGSTNSTMNTNCVNLNISNFNNLNTFTIKRINLGSLTLSSLPSLVNFTNNGTSCNEVTSSLLLTNLPLLYDVKILDLNLAIVNINNLNSLYNLELNCKKITSLNLAALPQLYNFKYNDFSSPTTSALPMLTIQNLPNLYSIYLSRMDIGGINLNNLNNLYSLIITNDQPSTSYTPQTINYSFSNFPNLNYVQLDEIKTTNLSFQNVPNLTTLKFRESTIGTSYSIQNLPLENLFIDDMSTLNNVALNNLPNFKNLSITQCSNIQSLNFGNTNTTLKSFFLKSTISIPSTSISSLNFTNFPQLNSLTINYYLTTLTLNNLPSLNYLNCSSNKLNALSLINFPQLNELVCNYNQPTTSTPYKWPLTLNLPQLTKLDVNYNNARLANLDLSNCPILNEIHYKLSNSNNTGIIPYLNLKNGNPNFSIFESNAITNICVDSSAEKTVLQGLNTNLQSTIFTTYCNFNPGGTFSSLQGNSKLDSNLNGCDSTDAPFPMINFSIESGGISNSYFADNTGNYTIPFIDGQYTVSPVFENPSYYTFSPTSVTLNFPTDASPVNQSFCVTPNGNHNDLEITLIPYIPARPGFDAIYKLNYKNKGNQVQSGTVNLNFNDALIDFVAANPTVASQAVNLLSWSFTNLQPFENRTITVTFNVNSPTEIPAVVSGTILNYSAQVIGMTDETPADNNCVLNQSVVNAFDPNDKTCLEGAIVTSSLIGDYVHYVVRFQNTGTANAQNIVVKDLIDLTKFDLTTLIPMTSSHSFSTRITNTNQVEFIFQNINLSYLTGSNNGYVAFKIKTKPTLTVGSTFNNYAEIYFDYNYPIITNNFSTTIQNPLANNQFESAKLSVYPNPVKDILYFKTNEDVLKVEVYDLAGRILSSSSVNGNKINLSNLNKGNYIIKIYSAETITNTKILKE